MAPRAKTWPKVSLAYPDTTQRFSLSLIGPVYPYPDALNQGYRCYRPTLVSLLAVGAFFPLHHSVCTCDVLPRSEPAGRTNATAHLWSSLARAVPVPNSRQLLCTLHSNHSLTSRSITPNACLSYTLHELRQSKGPTKSSLQVSKT